MSSININPVGPIGYGAPIIVSGTLEGNSGQPVPGEEVVVSLNNGFTQAPTTDDLGGFVTVFYFENLSVSGSPHTINALYVGDANNGIASAGASLTVTPAGTSFSNLSAPTITYGTATTTIFGHLDYASSDVSQPVPAGEAVAVTLNGFQQTASLDGSDNFSTTFDTSQLSVSGSPYTITFAYAGDGNFTSANASSTLTVNGSQVTPTSLTWDKAEGGVNLSYQVSGANLTQNVPIAFYWASGPNYSNIIGPADADSTYTVKAGTQAQAQAYGPIHIDGTDLIGAPQGATYLLAVADPNNTLGTFDPSKNVTPLQLMFSVTPVFQNAGPWANPPGTPLGHSQKDTIASSGCALTSLVMALNYQGISIDPAQLNQLLTAAPNGYADTDHVNWGPATRIAGKWAGVSVTFDDEDISSSNPQDLRDLIVSTAAPVIVSVNNPKTGHQHFVLVTGIDGDTFTINDPAYPGNDTLDAYDNSFTIRGPVLDPPDDLSALYLASAAAETGVTLSVTDPQGNVTGLASQSGQPLNQIPNSAYFSDGPVEDLDGPSSDDTTAQFVYVSQPESGPYSIQASGATTPAQLEFAYAAPNGALQTQQAGTVQSSSGAPLQYQVDLGSEFTLPPPFIQLTNEPTNAAGQVPLGTVGVPYTQTITAGGGSNPLTISYQVTNGTIPTGLNFNVNGYALTISGTPTTNGNVSFSVSASDSSGDQTALDYSLTINPALPTPPPGSASAPPPSTNNGTAAQPPSQFQALLSLYIDAAYLESFALLLNSTPGGIIGLDNLGFDPTETAKATANAAAAGINFNAVRSLNNFLGSLLIPEGLGPGNVVADIQFNLPYAGPLGPLALMNGAEGALLNVQQPPSSP